MTSKKNAAILTSLVASAAACLLLAIEIKKKKVDKKKKKRCWIKDYRKSYQLTNNVTNILKELELASLDYRNFLQIEEICFEKILSAIRADITKTNTHFREAIRAEKKLAVTLRFLARGETYSELDQDTKISKSFLAQAIPDVCDAIYKNMKDEYLKFPKENDEWLKIANDFELMWQFPHCIGALGAKHISFTPNRNNATYYYNDKGFHSIILLAVADAYGQFIFVDIGCNGKMSNNDALTTSDLMKILQKSHKYLPKKKIVGNNRLLPYVFACDEEFTLLENMLIPYPITTSNEYEQYFNERLSIPKRAIERSFEIFTNRFGIFQKKITLNDEKTKKILQCCCVLHNFLLRHSKWYREYNSYIPSEPNYGNYDEVTMNHFTLASESFRNNFVQYFNNEGKLI